MAQTLETIRLLKIRAVAEGLEKVASDHRKMAEAAKEVSDAFRQAEEAGAQLAKSTDLNANKTLNGLKSWNSYARSTDAVSKALWDFERGLKTVTRALDQEHIGGSRFFEEMERLDALLDKVGLNREIALNIDTMGLEAARKAAQDTVRARELEAQIAREQIVTERALQATIERRAQKARDDAEALARIEAKAAQDRWNAYAGVDRTAATEGAGRSMATINELEREHLRILEREKREKEEIANVDKRMVEEAAKRAAREKEYAAFVERQAARQQQLDNLRTGHQGEQRRMAWDEITGVSRTAATDAGAGYSALEEREKRLQQLQAKRKEILERTQPLIQAQARYEDEMKEITEMVNLKLLEGQQIIDAQNDALKRRQVQEQAHTIGGGRLGRADITNLGYQLSDIVSMAGSGSSPLQILTTQGPQIAQILAGGNGSIRENLRAVGTALGQLVTPTTVTVTALVGGAAAAAAAWSRYDDSIRNVERSLMGLGRSTMGGAGTLVRAAEAGAGAAGFSDSVSRAAFATFASTGRISIDLMDEARNAAKDLAVMTGQELPDSLGDLATKLADPGRGVEELDKQFNLFTVTQLKAIQRMAETGDRAGAQAAILGRLNTVIGDASNKTSIWARAWESVANGASQAIDKVGKAVDRVVSGPSLEERLREAQQARRIIEERTNTPQANRRRAAAAGPNGGQDPATATRQLEYNLQEDVRRQNQLEYQRGQEARVSNLSRDMAKIYTGMQPVNDAISEMTKNIEALSNAIKTGEFKLLPPEEQARIREALNLTERMRALAERHRAAGGQAEYEGRAQARFGLETSTMTDLERSIADINEQYRVQVEQARANKETNEQLAAAERSLKQIRDDQLEALRRSTALGIMRDLAPENFEAESLQERLRVMRSVNPADIGKTQEQVDQAIQRLEERLRNLKTPLQQLVEQYQDEQRVLTATNAEQRRAAEAQQTYNQAINSGRTELEAIVEAMAAFNRSLVQSQKAAHDAVREAQRNAQMVGLTPIQRQQMGIRNQYDDLRREHGNLPGFDRAQELDEWAAKQEALRGPLEEANRALNEQISSARVQAETFGKTTAEIEAAAEAQRLKNEYDRQGITITESLGAAIQAHAQRYGEAKQAIQLLQQQQKDLQSYRDMGKGFFTDLLSDLRQGKDMADSLANALGKVADKIWEMMVNSMFDPNSQSGFNVFQVLFGGINRGSALPSLTSTGAATQSIATAMPNVNLGQYAPQAQGILGGINTQIAGSLVPFMQSQTQAAAKQVTSTIGQTIGGTFTKASDGLRNEVEQYLRIGAQARGMDPDIIARGIRQESGFNPFARGDNGASYGVMQLYTKGGLGNEALKRGISLDPSNWKQQVDFGLDYMQKKGFGEWYGFRDIGIRDPWAAHKAFRGASLTGGYGQNTMAGGMGADTLAQNFDQLNQSTANLAPNMAQFGTGLGTMTQNLTAQTPQLQQGLSALTNTVGQQGAGVGNALQTTSNTVLQSGQGLGSAFQQAAQALQGGGGGGIGGFFKSLFGGGGSDPFTNGGSLDWGQYTSGVSFGSYHGGGDVSHGGHRLPMSLMDQIAFMSAPALHRGSLKHDEIYAKLQTGEKVLSRDDVRMATRNASLMAQPQAVAPAVNVNVENNGPGEARVERKPNGDIDVIIDEVDNRLAGRARRGRGALVKAIPARQSGQGLIG